MTCSIVFKGVSIKFDSAIVLEDITFKVEKGAFFGVLGPNGSGKTTLLRCIARSLKPSTGEILVFDRPLNEYKSEEYSRIVSAMLPNWPGGFSLKAYEIVLMGCKNRSKNFWWEKEDELKVAEESLKLLDALHLFDRDFDTLSSGEQRKVLIAKSIAQRTDIILLDEPVAYLDIKHKLEVMDILKTLAELGKTVIVSLHELELASRYCDKILILSKGRLFALGEPKKVINQDLIREVYGVDADVIWNERYNYPIIIMNSKKAKKEVSPCLKEN